MHNSAHSHIIEISRAKIKDIYFLQILEHDMESKGDQALYIRNWYELRNG